MAYTKSIRISPKVIFQFKYDIDPSGDGLMLIWSDVPRHLKKERIEAIRAYINKFLKTEWEQYRNDYERNKLYV